MLRLVIYADYNATTPCLPAVIEAVRLQLAVAGNPSSRSHAAGRQAADVLAKARSQVAELLCSEPERIIFTSGATEACNLAIFGVAERLLGSRRRFVHIATEHPAVLEPHRRLREAGCDVVSVPVDTQGRVQLEALAQAVDGSTALVSAMAVNNETGVISDIPAIARLSHAQGALVLCDATQALGRLSLTSETWGPDFIACSAHKLYGPPGVGALWIRRGLSLEAQLLGGGQERGLRSGSHNLPGIVGFGVAASAAGRAAAQRHAHLTALTSELETTLRAAMPQLVIHGGQAVRVPGTSFISCPGLPRGWLAQLTDVAASGGSSCSSGTGKPSQVLLAMGVAHADAANAIRISLGVPSTSAEVMIIAQSLIDGARRLQGLAPATP